MSKKKVNPLKLYMVSVQYPPHVNGIEGKIVPELADKLKKNGEEITYCTLGIGDEIEEEKIYDPELKKKRDKNPIVLLRFSATDSKSIKEPYDGTKSDEIRRFKSISEEIANFVGIQQGVIHLNGNNAIPYLSKVIKHDLHLYNATGSIKKIISSFYNLESLSLKLDPTVNPNVIKEIKELEALSFKYSDKIVVDRDFIKTSFKEIAKSDYNDKKIFILPLPVNEKLFEETLYTTDELKENRKKLDIWEDSKIILSILDSNNNLGTNFILDSLKNMKEKVSLIIMSQFKDLKKEILEEIKIKIKSTENDNVQVKLLNIESEEDKYKVIDDCSIYISPNLNENSGLDLLEAWARAKPVIANNTQSNQEKIKDNTGILLDLSEESIKTLENSINELLENSEKASEMGKNGKKIVLDNHTWEKYLSNYLKVYKE